MQLKGKNIPVSFVLLLILLISLIAGPLLIDYDPVTHDLGNSYHAPNTGHLMGTDKFGRDVLARVLYGGRISIWVALLSVSLSLLIGIPYGLLSGFFDRFDLVLNNVINVFMAIPQFLLILSVAAVLGKSSVLWIVLIIALFSWMDIARLVRNQTLALKHKDFILAETVIGISKMRLLFKHLLPNLMGPVAVSATLLFGNVILVESALSFVGLGVQPPTPSWGNIINEGRQVLIDGWWISVFPGVAIVVSVLLINLFGEYLQERFFKY